MFNVYICKCGNIDFCEGVMKMFGIYYCIYLCFVN